MYQQSHQFILPKINNYSPIAPSPSPMTSLNGGGKAKKSCKINEKLTKIDKNKSANAVPNHTSVSNAMSSYSTEFNKNKVSPTAILSSVIGATVCSGGQIHESNGNNYVNNQVIIPTILTSTMGVNNSQRSNSVESEISLESSSSTSSLASSSSNPNTPVFYHTNYNQPSYHLPSSNFQLAAQNFQHIYLQNQKTNQLLQQQHMQSGSNFVNQFIYNSPFKYQQVSANSLDASRLCLETSPTSSNSSQYHQSLYLDYTSSPHNYSIHNLPSAASLINSTLLNRQHFCSNNNNDFNNAFYNNQLILNPNQIKLSPQHPKVFYENDNNNNNKRVSFNSYELSLAAAAVVAAATAPRDCNEGLKEYKNQQIMNYCYMNNENFDGMKPAKQMRLDNENEINNNYIQKHLISSISGKHHIQKCSPPKPIKPYNNVETSLQSTNQQLAFNQPQLMPLDKEVSQAHYSKDNLDQPKKDDIKNQTNPINQLNKMISFDNINFKYPLYSVQNKNIKVKLHDQELWNEFSMIGTEMVITKPGRRMFPTVRFSISGLDKDTNYLIFLDIVLYDDFRYKYLNGRWIVNGVAETQCEKKTFLHPDSPMTGDNWMKKLISFHKVKLTNNIADSSSMNNVSDKFVLSSMHKYIPRLHIIEEGKSINTFYFDENVFMAVTSYQNNLITKLKIDHNPFAKGFREGQNTRRRESSHRSKRELDFNVVKQNENITHTTNINSNSSTNTNNSISEILAFASDHQENIGYVYENKSGQNNHNSNYNEDN